MIKKSMPLLALTVHRRIFLFFFLVFILRAVFAYYVPLIDDEAYHWSWTRNLMLSYFDHPGMIAWLERISTVLFGNSYFAVRLPSFICFSLVAIISWQLTYEIFDEWAAHFVAFLLLFTPLWGFGGYVASPEPPFMLAWISAAYVFYQGYREDGNAWSLKKTWLILGVLMGLGLNSKFIIALLAFGFGVYILLTPNRRKDLLSPWPWVGLLVATVITAPVFIWNLQNDWPGFKYQFHDRHQESGPLNFQRWLQFWAAQWAFYTPAGYLLILTALFYGFKRKAEFAWRFIFSLAIPSILIFYPQPLKADYKPHWAGAACLLLAMGAGALWSNGFRLNKFYFAQKKSRNWAIAILVFVTPFTFFVYTPFIYPWMPKVARMIDSKSTWNPRNDLSNEFYGWEEVGMYINNRQREIHAQTGKRPFIAAHRYETTAQTFWGTKQRVYMLSTTRSHYTVMQTAQEMENLKGLDALFLVSEKYPVNPKDWAYFDSCQPEEFKFYRDKELSRVFTVYWCKNFQGIRLDNN